jgi:NAD(P)-dependent dehydrogenase (short-subunit alcohol dehydrogenase family)
MKVSDMTLDGRTALVTGAAGGIGSAICRHLAVAGALGLVILTIMIASVVHWVTT